MILQFRHRRFGICSVVALVLTLLTVAGVAAWAKTPGDFLGTLAIQNSGRVKPFDSFSRETLQLIYGRQTMPDKGPSEIVLSWMLIPQEWSARQFVQVSNEEVRKALGLSGDKGQRYSPQELMAKVDVLQNLFQNLHDKQKAEEKLNNYDQAVQRLENQLSLFQGVVTGTVIKLVPPDSGAANNGSQSEGGWLGVPEWPEAFRAQFETIAHSFAVSVRSSDEGLQQLEQAVQSFEKMAQAKNPSAFPEPAKISTEVHLNQFHPFGWAWGVYLLSLLFLCIQWRLNLPWAGRMGWLFAGVAFFLHSYGFVLRMYLSGRPPVSNMYETVVWVSWGAVVFGTILSLRVKNNFLLIAADMVAFLCMLLADFAPTVLDGSLQPLQAVLRSNLWLTVHVLTITSSYAAFFLALFLGDIALSYYVRGERKFASEIQVTSRGVYLAMQVGVVLLAAGTILGGVWADYSWGRFWGWDPKETWALIALLGYIAVLHGRLSGWLQTFGFLVGAVVSFTLVIMAWYGVNFVLGAGKHSYGFGGGGLPYVLGFVALHLFYVVAVAIWRSKHYPARA